MPLVAFHRSERVSRVQDVVAEPGRGGAAPGVEPRLGRDVDEHHALLVRVGREHAAAEADLLDLVFRRQFAAPEPVHADRGAGPGHFFEDTFHLVGIVGQLVDLGLAEHGCERVVSRIAGALARIARHVDRLGEPCDLQPDLAPVLAAADSNVARIVRFEAW